MLSPLGLDFNVNFNGVTTGRTQTLWPNRSNIPRPA
jgi:hypothetical protein